MTHEEAKAEINKVFEPAFANYIITALTEGATPSERKEGFWDVYTDCEGKRTYYTCPFCKNKTNHFMYEPKYCDKCGARLKGSELNGKTESDTSHGD